MTSLDVNGRLYQVAAEGSTPLLYILRNDLGLNGPKFGCGLGQCGSCSVFVGDSVVRSCVYPLDAVGKQKISTVESLADGEHLHPLQAAFRDEQAAQCGYCTSGMLMAAKALLDRKPHPTEADIRESLASTLCRCGAHNRIVRAVQRAAKEMSS